MWSDWLTVWYTPEPNDVIAYITTTRIAEIGGATPQGLPDTNQINSGMAILKKWMRVNDIVGTPVNVRGKTGVAFKKNTDAVQFKLVWG